MTPDKRSEMSFEDALCHRMHQGPAEVRNYYGRREGVRRHQLVIATELGQKVTQRRDCVGFREHMSDRITVALSSPIGHDHVQIWSLAARLLRD